MKDDQPNYWQPPSDEEAEQAPQEDLAPSEQLMQVEDVPVNWAAHEYVHPPKNAWWFILFVIIVLGLIASDVFLLKSYTFSVLVLVMAVALIVYIRRPPRTIQYALSVQQGLYIGEKLYSLANFKGFGVMSEDGHHYIMLIPTKRFAPGVSVYFPEEAGEQIVDILGTRLPMQTLKLDAVDRLVRLLRL